jgi:hypothetical protein
MRIGSTPDSIYYLMQPKIKSDKSAGAAGQQTSPSGQSVGGTVSISGDSAAAALQSRLAQSSFDRNDTNHDGIVQRDEFIDNSMKPRQDGSQSDLADVVGHWNKLDPDGKGSLTEEEYNSAFSSLLQVSVGTFDGPLR